MAALYLERKKTKRKEIAKDRDKDFDTVGFAQMNTREMELLVKQGFLDSSKVSSLKFCEDCIYEKTHKINFSTGQHNTKNPPDYVHSDLWGTSLHERPGCVGRVDCE
ncbi:hypothetical protein N665_0035s0031 [Sinapis alba]|nr:hypothetical protein N665_0035s0031 [Sinapis alba]